MTRLLALAIIAGSLLVVSPPVFAGDTSQDIQRRTIESQTYQNQGDPSQPANVEQGRDQTAQTLDQRNGAARESQNPGAPDANNRAKNSGGHAKPAVSSTGQ